MEEMRLEFGIQNNRRETFSKWSATWSGY